MHVPCVQAPEDLCGVLGQRLRWAMGTLQILLRDNPLTRPGLTFVQSLLFWEAAVHHYLAITTVMLSLLPIVYIFTGVGQSHEPLACVTARLKWHEIAQEHPDRNMAQGLLCNILCNILCHTWLCGCGQADQAALSKCCIDHSTQSTRAVVHIAT